MLIWQDGEQSQDYQHEVQPRLNFCFKIKQINKTGSNSPWTNIDACGKIQWSKTLEQIYIAPSQVEHLEDLAS